jgi:aryl-alcohol dehydrogenase-like predicted oxidoreductase
MAERGTLPKRPLGKTGEEVSVLGLGGEGLLRSFDREEEAVPLIHRAIDLGITYFESARVYAGSEFTMEEPSAKMKGSLQQVP